MKLGQMTEVDIRTIWTHEQYDFSRWLASEENIAVLGDMLNLSLTDIETEKFVGSYRCDIICKDELTGKNVLIENQLEDTNHEHLGKIITYASGLDASVIVWIVASAREEHASAVEWLNKHTDDDVSFFKSLKDIYLKSRPGKRKYKSYIRPEVLACAIIIVKYPNETFENAKGEKTKVKYMSSDCDTLLKKAKLLDSFMMSI